MRKNFLLFILFIACHHAIGQSGKHVIDGAMHHLRNGDVREWSEFSDEAGSSQLKIDFSFKGKMSEGTLVLRQYDVKQDWDVFLNEKKLGSLATDEQDMVVYFSIPSGIIHRGSNELLIKCTAEAVDDIKVGKIHLDIRPLHIVLSEGSLDVQVFEGSSETTLPSRITITNQDGSLQTVTAAKKQNLAVRPGVVYTANGKVSFSLPAGNYRVYASRGFEYGVDSVDVTIKPGGHVKKSLRIHREVDTEGWISTDTHIHTYTYSQHGDATMEERAITVAGEGIELPVMTDHNVYVDLAPFAEAMDVSPFFTSVIGDELTTKVGHFNVFPTQPATPVISDSASDWNDIRKSIDDESNSKAIILNHARDIHNGFRPFDPSRHLSSAGTGTDTIHFPANAMEIINSGSQQTQIMNLVVDWFGMLNRGHHLTPVGSSDSHDVSRYIVGQGRTYLKGIDKNPGQINADAAIKSFKNSEVMVSLGLLSKIKVNNQYGPGELASASGNISVKVEVWGPAWAKANRVVLYANGQKIREEKISDEGKAGLKWEKTWMISSLRHDVFLVAVAEGPGSGMPFWPIAKPYQPSSPEWTPTLMGLTGPVWIDTDGNGNRNAAFDYATEIIDASLGSLEKIMDQLRAYDRAVAIQVAMLLWKQGKNLASQEISEALKTASEETKAGFKQLMNEVEKLAMVK